MGRRVVTKSYDSSYMNEPKYMGIYITDLVVISSVLFFLSRFLSKTSTVTQYTAYGIVGGSIFSFLAFKNSFLPRDYVYYLSRRITTRKKKKISTKRLV